MKFTYLFIILCSCFSLSSYADTWKEVQKIQKKQLQESKRATKNNNETRGVSIANNNNRNYDIYSTGCNKKGSIGNLAMNDNNQNPYGEGVSDKNANCLMVENYGKNKLKQQENEGKRFLQKYAIDKNATISESYNRTRPDYNGVDARPE